MVCRTVIGQLRQCHWWPPKNSFEASRESLEEYIELVRIGKPDVLMAHYVNVFFRSSKNMPSYKPVTAVLRALEVLKTVNRLRQASVGDLYKETKINRATIVRMLETLMHAGFVARHPTQSAYITTGRSLELSSGYDFHQEVEILATPILTSLGKRISWPSDVAIFEHNAMVVAATNRGEGPLAFNRRAGYRAPVFGTSLGLAYIAFCDEVTREQARIAVSKLPEPWNVEAQNKVRLKRTLDSIRKRGFATMPESYSKSAYDGVALSIGVPIIVNDLAVASLNMMFLREAFTIDEAAKRYVDRLKHAAAQVAQAFPPKTKVVR